MKKSIAEAAKNAAFLQMEIRNIANEYKNKNILIFNHAFRELYLVELMRSLESEIITSHLKGSKNFKWIFDNDYPLDIYFSSIVYNRLKLKDENIVTNLQAFDEACCVSNPEEILNDLKTKSNFFNYLTELENKIKQGFTYSTLMQITPAQYDLPDTWLIDKEEYTQEKSIFHAIFFAHDLLSLNKEPLLKIATDLQISYDKMLDAENFIHSITNNNNFF